MNQVKITLNLTTDDIAILEALALSSFTTKTAVLRRSLATLHFFAQAKASNRKVLIESRPGRFRELLFPV